MNDDYEESNKTTVDDWAISEPKLNLRAPESSGKSEILSELGNDDWAIYAPQTNPSEEVGAENWQMPEPVFRKSAGKTLKKSEDAALPNDLAIARSDNEIRAAAVIQPQPLLFDDAGIENSVKTQPTGEKNKFAKTPLIILCLIAMIIFVVAFLISVYFLFFYSSDV